MDGGSAEAWLISFTKQLRVNLPQGNGFLTYTFQEFLTKGVP